MISVSSKEKCTNGATTNFQIYFAILIVSMTAFLAASYFEASMSTVQALEKPYKSFEEFFPFYMSQHQNEICRRLHFVGTSIVVFMMAYRPYLAISIIPAYFVGSTVRILTQHLSTGLIEGIAAFSVLIASYKSISGVVNDAVALLLIGYGFAWIGHFVFEKNRPATFIYPIYSLTGDFKMWYDFASGKLKM